MPRELKITHTVSYAEGTHYSMTFDTTAAMRNHAQELLARYIAFTRDVTVLNQLTIVVDSDNLDSLEIAVFEPDGTTFQVCEILSVDV